MIQIAQDFERQLLSGQRAAVQVIADGRNSNTAGTALGYVARIVDRFNRLGPRSWRRPTPVQVTLAPGTTPISRHAGT